MNRAFLWIAILALATGVHAANKKPNILYIFADDLSHRAVSCYPEAYPWVKTPNIDRLAREGIRFARAYTGTFCVPSRVSALTGNLQHSTSRKVDVNSQSRYRGKKDIPWEELREVQRVSDFWPRRLREIGYYNGIIGKWHVKAQPPAFGMDWDWGVWWDQEFPGNYGGDRYYWGICTERYKYIRVSDADDVEEVYDLKNDPEELTNLAVNPEFRPKLRELRKLCVDEFRKTRWDVDTGGKHFIDLFPEPLERVISDQ